MAKTLEPRQTHHRQKRSDVQAWRRRIEADVSGQLFLCENVAQIRRRFIEHSAPLKFVVEIHGFFSLVVIIARFQPVSVPRAVATGTLSSLLYDPVATARGTDTG